MAEKILKKAYIVWHDGMLVYSNPEGFSSWKYCPSVYATGPGQAKQISTEWRDWSLDSYQDADFTDLYCRRYPADDLLEVDGEQVIRHIYTEKKADDEYRAKLNNLPDQLYLIRAIDKGFRGNYPVWWGPNSTGYTTDFNKAGRYSKWDVVQICKKGQQEPWPESCLQKHLVTVVNYDRLRRQEANNAN